METELKELEAEIRMKHPEWPQEKKEWIAKRLLGITGVRSC